MHSRYFFIPTLSLIAGIGVAQAADDLQIHGFVSQGYLVTMNNALFAAQSEDNGTFEFNEMALNVVATPIERLRVGIQVAAQDLGDSFNNKPTIDWAFGNYSFGTIAPGVDFSVSAGRFKMGHGLYNDYRDLDMTRSSVFLPMAVYNPRWREIILAVNGVGANASIQAGAMGVFDINGFAGNNNFSASEGPLHDIFADIDQDTSSLSTQSVLGGQITWNVPVEGLKLKYSLLDATQFKSLGTYSGAGGPGSFVPGTAFNLTMTNYWDNIASVEYQWKEFTLAAEYDYTYYRSKINGTFNTGFGNIPLELDQATATHATYISAAYRVLPKWEVVGGWQWSQTELDLGSSTKWYAWNAAVRYDVKENWLIKAEYQWTHGTGLLRTAEQPDGTLEETWGYFALKTTFDF